MIKYMIHACNKREWYAEQYLVPSMVKQGINPNEIFIYTDVDCLGNLKACIDSFDICNEYFADSEYIWHLQDDVIICSDFKKRTDSFVDKMKKENISIAAGFCGYTFGPDLTQYFDNVSLKEMWYSFQCICIKTELLNGFKEWVEEARKSVRLVKKYCEENKYDDAVFHIYLKDRHKFIKCYNIKPNLVDHIYYLIGGTTINQDRNRLYTSLYFEEPELVEKLKQELENKKSID